MRDVVRQKILAGEREAVLFSQRHHALDFHGRAFAREIGLDGIEKIFAGANVRHVEMDLGMQIGIINSRRAGRRHFLRCFQRPGHFRRAAVCERDRPAGKAQVGAKDRVPDLSASGHRRGASERLRKFCRDRLQVGKRSSELDGRRAAAEFSDVRRQLGVPRQAQFVQARRGFSRIESRYAIVRFEVKNGVIEEKVFLAQIIDLRIESAVPRARRVDDSLAGNREALDITGQKFRRPPEIAAQGIERNLLRDDAQFHIQRTRRLAQRGRTRHGPAGHRRIQHHFERSGSDVRRVESNEPELVFVIENQPAQDQILVRVGCARRDLRPGVRVRNLQGCDPKLAGVFGIEIDVKMFQDEILRRRPNEKVHVGKPQPLGEDREQPDPRIRRGNLRFQRSFGGIQDDVRAPHFGVLQKLRGPTAREVDQAVVRPNVIDVDRFDDGRPDWRHVEISDGETGENRAFKGEIDFQVGLRRVVVRHRPGQVKNDRPMEDQDDREQDKQSPTQTARPSPALLHEGFSAFIHEGGNLFPRG